MNLNCGRGCSTGWDVRCCCEFNCPAKNSNLQFHRCPMMINTVVFHIGNDYGLYSCAIEDNFDFLLDYFEIDCEETQKKIIALFKEDR